MNLTHITLIIVAVTIFSALLMPRVVGWTYPPKPPAVVDYGACSTKGLTPETLRKIGR